MEHLQTNKNIQTKTGSLNAGQKCVVSGHCAHLSVVFAACEVTGNKTFAAATESDRMVARAKLRSCGSPGEQSSLSALPVAATSCLFPL